MSIITQERETILPDLNLLINKAENDGMWLHCEYQDLWFSPQELRRANTEGRFIWGAVNWSLRDPKEKLNRLKQSIENAEKQYRDFHQKLSAGGWL